MTDAKAASPTVAVVGNPNCGKTTLFNLLTGSTQQVGNWPGVTVEKKVGRFRHGGTAYTLVDLPGVYMLGAVSAGSEDERVARDYVLSGQASVVVNIVDGSNLERNLYLTTQLLEMRVPMVVAVNMMDMATRNGMALDLEELSRRLDCPVVPLIASRGKGIDGLKEAIATACAAPRVPVPDLVHAPAVLEAVSVLEPVLAPAAAAKGVDARWAALKLLEGDAFADSLAGKGLSCELEAQRQRVEEDCGAECDIMIADGRYRFIDEAMRAAFHMTRTASATLSQRIDKVVLNRFLGVPVFLFAMYLMFMFTINVGGAFIDLFDQAFGAVMVDEAGALMRGWGMPEWATVVVTGIGGGVQTVSTFVPIIACLFLFLSFLEDSGYMARAAFVVDRAMRAIGLPGKSFVPLIVGFGCNVPAIMATRTLDSRRDRIMTILMAPFMSCGARLPVYVLFAAAFFPVAGQNVVFALYLIGLLVAVLTGLILKGTLLRGEASHFVMELPPYHLPTLRAVVMQAWQRLREFIVQAGQVIVPVVAILSVLNAVGTDGSFDKQDSRESVLAAISQSIVPVFEPMGLREDNWPAAVGLFTGIFAKEAVVGTLNVLYAQAAESDAVADGSEAAGTEAVPELTLGDKLLAAVATVPENFAAIADSLGDPLGLDVSYIAEGGAASALEVEDGLFGAMASRFDGAAGAFAYMVIILLYTPCVATLGAIRQETNLKWTAFAAAWTTGTGYVVSVGVYQTATFGRDPATATLWLAICAAIVGSGLAALWIGGRVQNRRGVAGQAAE